MFKELISETISRIEATEARESSRNLCPHFDKLFRPPAVPVVSRRDPRSAFRGLWTAAQAAVQSTAVFAFKRRFLARGSRFFHGATLI